MRADKRAHTDLQSEVLMLCVKLYIYAKNILISNMYIQNDNITYLH